jgi:tripartite-type tricarboxylate transporter receptor subunit TctC
MLDNKKAFCLTGLIYAASCMALVSAKADTKIGDFYKGRTITIVVGSDSGGGYDLTARALSRHMARFIPGQPTIIVQNKPGASSLAAANFVAEAAPKDGTVIAAVQRPVPFQFLFGHSNVNLDLKKLQWLGSTAKEPGVFVAWHTSPQHNLDDLRKGEMIVGGNGPATDTELFARTMNNLFGTKLKIVSGYPGQNDIILSMQRNEVQGVANWSWSDIESRHQDWINDKRVRFLVQFALEPIQHPAMKDVPFILDLARTADERAVLHLLMQNKALGRPYFVAPEVPSDKVAALREAFDATMLDEAFRADAAKTVGVIDAISGQDMQAMLGDVYKLPEDLIDRARKAVGTDKIR